jgi:hypothetical protein
MSELAVITPSYAPDLELCADLNESVLLRTPDSVKHYIVVPRRDRALFSRLSDSRTEVLTVDELLPWSVIDIPRSNFWLNLRQPIPPVRGWVMQQLIKMQIAEHVDADLYILADSDVLLVRPVNAQTFRTNGRTQFYRVTDEITEQMPRHVVWHRAAEKLLGLSRESPPLPDYVSAFNVWDRAVIRALQERISQTTGKRWLDAVGGQLHFSEFIIYGVFVDRVLGSSANVAPTDSMLCHSYWHPRPLDLTAAEDFVRKMPEEDVAIMISAKSGTPLDTRRKALSTLR